MGSKLFKQWLQVTKENKSLTSLMGPNLTSAPTTTWAQRSWLPLDPNCILNKPVHVTRALWSSDLVQVWGHCAALGGEPRGMKC